MKVKRFEWNKSKNEVLKIKRGISFEEVQSAIDEGQLLNNEEHYNKNKYPNQQLFIVQISNYVYIVPYVEDSEKIFLKTIFPSRKATKKYLKPKSI